MNDLDASAPKAERIAEMLSTIGAQRAATALLTKAADREARLRAAAQEAEAPHDPR